MDGVSSSTESHFQDQIADLNSKLRQMSSETQKARKDTAKGHREDVEALGERHDREVARVREEADRAILEAKSSAKESIELERKKADADVKELERQLYNRKGSVNTEARALREQLAESHNALQSQEKDALALLKIQDKANNARVRKLNEDSELAVEKAVQDTIESVKDARVQRYLEDKNDYHAFKTDLEGKYRKLSEDYADSLSANRRESESAIEDVKRDYANRMAKEEQAGIAKVQALQEEMKIRTEKTAENLIAANARDTAELRGEIRKLLDARSESIQGRAEGRAEAIREYEMDSLNQQKSVWDAANRGLEKEKQTNAMRQETIANNFSQRLEEMEGEFAEILRKREGEVHLEKQELVKSFEKNNRQLASQMKKQSDSFDRKLLRQAVDAEERQLESTKLQNEAFQTTLSNLNKEKNSEIDRLKGKLQGIKTNADVNNVPPAVEQAVRQSFEKEFKAEREADQQRAQDAIDSTKDSYSGRMQDLIAKQKDEKTKLTQQSTRQRDKDRNQFVAFAQESEYNTKQKLAELERSHKKQMENLTRNFQKAMRTQRNRFTNIIEDIKVQNEADFSALRTETGFDRTMTRRKSDAKLNDTIRNYERRLDQQDQDFQLTMETMKAEYDRKFQEMQRAQAQEIDVQKRGFTHRVAQLELQNEQRQRSLVSNYEEIIDRIKRANERLIRQKS